MAFLETVAVLGAAKFGQKVLESVAGTVAQKVAKGVTDQLSKPFEVTPIEKAIAASLRKAQEEVDLFYPAEQGRVEGFLKDFFSKDGVVQELQKPLKQEGERNPDVALLVKRFETALKEDKKVNDFTKALKKDERSNEYTVVDKSLIESWIRAFVKTYIKQTPANLEFEICKEDYLKQLKTRFGDVKFAGITVDDRNIEQSEKLVDIFVMPDVVEEVRNRSFESELLLEKTGSRQEESLREQQQRVQLENRSGRKFLAAELLSQSQSQKAVLLGAPGVGKTTLLSYFAVMLAQKQVGSPTSDFSPVPLGDPPPAPLKKGGAGGSTNITGGEKNVLGLDKGGAGGSTNITGGEKNVLGLDADTDWLPILIRIRDLAREPDDRDILDFARQFAEKRMSVKKLPEGFFEYWLEDGRALILLDGLDEVADSSKRSEMVQRIESFLERFNQNRAIITSRPAGYRRDFFRTDKFSHYELEPFDDAKIEKFIKHWYDSRELDQERGKRCQDSLNKALNENDRIKLLARNPLLLTIIALIHRYQSVLPKQRHKLYEKAVETLLTSWDKHKELSAGDELKHLSLDDLRRLMKSLACWIHKEGSTGEKEGGTLIERDELIEQLSRTIKTLKKIQPYEAKAEAQRLVDFIRERTGLLNEQGQDYYGFVHKTFQEYLCAQDIIEQAEEEDDDDIILEHIKEYLHDAHWREVLLLLIAQQKGKKATKAIRVILNKGSEYEQWLHRDLFFACRCLAENPERLRSADNDPSPEILKQLVDLEVDDSGRVGRRVHRQVFQLLCSLNETEFQEEVLQCLNDKKDRIDEYQLLYYRAALGEKEAVIKTWLEKLKDEESRVRSSAADALGNLGKAEPTVVSALLELLKDEKSDVRFSAADALGNLGKAEPTVVSALLELLKDEKSDVRFSAADALGNLGKAEPTVVSALLELLKDEESRVRSSAADALGNLGKAEPTVVSALLELLKDEKSDVRYRAALALGNLGKAEPTVVSALLELLKDEESRVRYRTALALGNLGKAEPTVVSALLELLKDEESRVRSSAADALGNLGKAEPTVVSALLELLKDEESRVRSSAADALGNLGKAEPTVVSALLELLKDEESRVRSSAALALGNLGKAEPTVVSALLELLKDEVSYLRYRAALALRNLGSAEPTVVSALLELLKDEVSYLRSSTASDLGKLGKKSCDVLPAVAQWIEQHQDSEYVGSGIDALWDLVQGGE